MATTKLTDAQRVILAAAGARESGLVLPLPNSLGNNRGTLGVILKSLLTRELIAERPVQPDEEVWRETEEMGRTTLVISVAGLQLMGIEPTGQGIEQDIVGSSAESTSISPNQGAPEPNAGGAALPKEGTKLGALIAALRKPDGATIPEMMQATRWQAHSVRGAMSGNLKKKLNLEVTSEVIENRRRVYRIAANGSAE
jgi:hypothetical protein